MRFPLLLALIPLMVGCKPSPSNDSSESVVDSPVEPPAKPPTEEPAALEKAAPTPDAKVGEGGLASAQGLNEFALRLYREIEKDDMTVLSPFSIAMALSLLELGARGETASLLLQTLGSADATAHRAGLAALLPRLRGGGPVKQDYGEEIHPHVFQSASGIWIANDYHLDASYLESAKALLDARVEAMDVAKPARAAREISDWVSEQTNGKIRDLVGPGSIQAATRAVLVNATYFQGRWKEPFREDATTDSTFWVDGKTEVKVPTMSTGAHFPVYQDESVTIVEMPYWSTSPSAEMAMTLLLPAQRDGLVALEAGLDNGTLQSWLGKLETRVRVSVHLPRWKAETTLLATGVLSELGLGPIFDGSADLSGVSQEEGLQVDEVLHRTFITVDEKGTEAAAATALMMAGGVPQKPIEAHFAHPFLYLIRERTTGAILFVGRVSDPR